MLKSKLFTAAVVVFALSGIAHAATESGISEANPTVSTSMTSNANIRRGDWNVGGFFDFVKNSGRKDDASEVSASLTARYFLIDRFGLGLSAGLDKFADQDTIASLGPSGTYFFWNEGKLASHADLGFRFGLTDATVKAFVMTGVGLEYFVAPTVAFGPSLFFNHYLSRRQDYNRFGVSFGLDVFL